MRIIVLLKKGLLGSILLAAMSSVSVAKEAEQTVVYRWVDSTGRAHYGQEAPPSVVSEQIKVEVTPVSAKPALTEPAPLARQSAKPKTEKPKTDKPKAKRPKKQPTHTALERQRLSRRSKCIEAQAKLRRIDTKFRSGFKSREGERLRERQRTWTMVKNEYCSDM